RKVELSHVRIIVITLKKGLEAVEDAEAKLGTCCQIRTHGSDCRIKIEETVVPADIDGFRLDAHFRA
ncbi:hypothetical protein ACC687_39840, partial [Rhizobium ruizarguesonis]